MKKYIGVYMITNTSTNQVYIGASTDIKRRWSNHNARGKKGIHTYPCFNDIDNVRYEILEECQIDELQEREEFWMGYMSNLFTVINKSKAGRVPINSEEAKLIKSQSQKGSLNGNCRLSEQDIFAIKQLCNDGDYTQVKVAEMFGISPTHVCNIVHGKKWSCLEEDNKI